jgi:hypothetical protein
MPSTLPRAIQVQRLKAISSRYGVKLAAEVVCTGHTPPAEFLRACVYDRPDLLLVLGPRGGGKSFLAALATHVDSIQHPGHATTILGGSESQSQQIFRAIRSFDRDWPDFKPIANFNTTRVQYRNGSEVGYLPASEKSVRGPHVPTLRLDEIDEIDPEIRQAALGMCMDQGGVSASVTMTSTWHRIGGPMAQLLDQARDGAFPIVSFCTFEVLERCPAERSGLALERCPECPLVEWCHDTADGIPKAKRSDGHYGIASLIQKVRGTSRRIFEADYLCCGPKADGLWFKGFDSMPGGKHVRESAEYDPALPVYVAVDSGVFTGGVWFQVRESGDVPLVTVFADYLSEGLSAESNARAIMRVSEQQCQGRAEHGYTDPAGSARNPVGPTVLAEYARCGLRLRPWPVGSISDGLSLIEGKINPAAGPPSLFIHPRCKQLITAFRSYTRAKRAGQWMDYPQDPQHPHEDLLDSLRGGLYARFPGRRTLRITPLASVS